MGVSDLANRPSFCRRRARAVVSDFLGVYYRTVLLHAMSPLLKIYHSDRAKDGSNIGM